MGRFLRGLVLAAVGVMLAGCFISETSLIEPGEAAFPFQEIAFSMSDGEEATLVRDGDNYVMATGEDKVLLRFQAIRDNYYAVQIGSGDAAEGWLFALMEVDLQAGTAKGYKMIGSRADVAPGLTLCDEVICIASLRAYVDHAMAAVEAGAEPEETYTIRSTR